MAESWYLRNRHQPVLDSEKENFLITVITPYENLDNLETRMSEARYPALLSLILGQNRYVTKKLFLEILEQTEAMDWYIDPRPCSKLRVLVSVGANLFKSQAPHAGTLSPAQAQSTTKNRIYSAHDRVNGVPLMAYPALRFIERTENLQDQLAEDTKNNIRDIIRSHVSEAAYYEEADQGEPCANPDAAPVPLKNSRDALNDVLSWDDAPPGTRYTEIPTKHFKKTVDDFVKILEDYHDEIQNSEYTLVPPLNLKTEARKLKQVPGILDKLFLDNTYQEYIKLYNVGTKVPPWKKVVWKNLAVEGGELRKNKEDVLRIGFSEDFNVNFVALNQKNFWRLDNWKIRKEYGRYKVIGSTTVRNDAGDPLGWDGAVVFKRPPPPNADIETLTNLGDPFSGPFAPGTILKIAYWAEEKNGYVKLTSGGWVERAILEGPVPGVEEFAPELQNITWTSNRGGRLTRDPTEAEKNGEKRIPHGSEKFGGEAKEIKREASMLEDIGIYPAHWKVPENGWSAFKKSGPICSATTMSLLFYMVQYFADVEAGNFGGGRPDWKEFLGSEGESQDYAEKQLELARAGYSREEAERILSQRFGGYVYSPPEIVPNPPAPGPAQAPLNANEPEIPPWASPEDGKLLKDLKKEFDANPVKSIKQLHEENKKMLAKGVKNKIIKDRNKAKQNVADNITQNLEALKNRINALEDLYTEVLDKYGIENLIKLALECLAAQTGIPFDQLPSIDALISISCPPPPTFSPPTLPDVVLEAAAAIPGLDIALPIPEIPAIPNPCDGPPKAPRKPKFPKIEIGDLMGPMIKEIMEAILQMLLEALLGIILSLLQMLLEMCINEGNIEGGTAGDSPLSNSLGINPGLENALKNFGIPLSAMKSPNSGAGGAVGPDGAPAGADGSGLFGDIGNCLTPAELCALLSGNPSPLALRIVEGIIASQYGDLRGYLIDQEAIRGFFQEIGGQTQIQNLCDEIARQAEDAQIDLNVCTTEERDAIRCALLGEKGLSKEECAELLDKARCRQKDAFDNLINLLQKPNILVDVLPDNLIQSPCNPEGIIPRDPPFMMRANEGLVDSVLGVAISAFQNDIDAYVPMLLAASSDHFGFMNIGINPVDMPYEVFPAYSIGPGADLYLRGGGGSRRELRYKINKAKQYGYDRLDGRDPIASWDGDPVTDVPAWMRKSGGQSSAKYRNIFFNLWLGRSRIGDAPNIKDPPPREPIGNLINRMKSLERLPPMPHHMVYRLPKLSTDLPEFGKGEKTPASKLVLPTLKQGLDDVQETTLSAAEVELKNYLGVTDDLLAAAGIPPTPRQSAFRAAVNQGTSNRTNTNAGYSSLSTFLVDKIASDADRSLPNSLKTKIHSKFGSSNDDMHWSKIKDISRIVADSKYFIRENIQALDWTPEDRPPHCPPPHPNTKQKGLLDPDDAKDDVMREYMTPSCEEDADSGVDGPGPLELSLLASIISLIIRVHIVEIVIKGMFVFSEYNIQETFRDPAVVKFLIAQVRNNLKYNMVFDNIPASKSFYSVFSDRTVQLIERRVRRGEPLQLPNGTPVSLGQKVSIRDAIEIIAREQIPEVSELIGEILNSPASDTGLLDAMPILDVPASVDSNGESESKRFGTLESRINDGMFFVERYIRVEDKTGNKYLDRDDKYRGAVNLKVWQNYWDNIDLGNFSNKQAKATHHFKSWKFGYRICFLHKDSHSIVNDLFGLTSAGWETNQQRREKTYKLKDDGKWYYPIVVSAVEENVPFSATNFVPGGYNPAVGPQPRLPDEPPAEDDKITALKEKQKALEGKLTAALETGETELEKKFAASKYTVTDDLTTWKTGSFDDWLVEGIATGSRLHRRRKLRDRLIWMCKKYNVKYVAVGLPGAPVPIPGIGTVPDLVIKILGWNARGTYKSSGIHTGMRQNSNKVLADAIQAKINILNAEALANIIIDYKITSVETPHNPFMFDERGRRHPEPDSGYPPFPPGLPIPLIMDKTALMLVPGGKKELERIVRLYIGQFDRMIESATALGGMQTKSGKSTEEAADLAQSITDAIAANKGVKNKTGFAAHESSLKGKLASSPAYQQAVVSDDAGGGTSSVDPLSTITVYTINSVEAALGTRSLQLFRQTKGTLRMLWGMLENSTDPHYEDPEQPSSPVASRRNARQATTSPNSDELAAMILKMIFMTPLYILKGLAELIDPNIIVSNILRRLSTKPEQHLKHVVFPPGMFDSKSYQLMAPKPPKPPQPPAPPVLGQEPWILPDPPQPRGTDPDLVLAHEKAMERYNMVVDVITEAFDKVVGPIEERYDEYNKFWAQMDEDHKEHNDGTRNAGTIDEPETVDFTPKDGFPTFPLIPLLPLGIVYLLLEVEDPAEKEQRAKKRARQLADPTGKGDEC